MPRDSTYIRALYFLSFEYVYIDPLKAIDYGQQALALAEKAKDKIRIAISLNYIGHANYVQGNYDLAIDKYLKSLRLAQELANSNSDYYIKEGKDGIAASTGNLGRVYRVYENFDKAIEYHSQALKMKYELDHKNGIAGGLNDLGTDYNQKAQATDNAVDCAMAIEYYTKSLKMYEELEDEMGIGGCLMNLGNSHKFLTQYNSALEYYFSALNIYLQINDKNGIANVLGNIGIIYFSKGEETEAETYLLNALEVARNIGALNIQDGVFLVLSKVYEEKGSWQRALEYYKKHTIAKDSLFNEEKSKDIGKLEAKHEFETAEAERARALEVKSQKEKVKRERRDNLQYSGILIFLVLVFTGVFMLGKFSIPIRLAEGMIFFSFLLFFEFTLVLLDPYIEQYSSGAPAIKLGFNAILAGLIFPLHSFFESKLKRKLVK